MLHELARLRGVCPRKCACAARLCVAAAILLLAVQDAAALRYPAAPAVISRPGVRPPKTGASGWPSAGSGAVFFADRGDASWDIGARGAEHSWEPKSSLNPISNDEHMRSFVLSTSNGSAAGAGAFSGAFLQLAPVAGRAAPGLAAALPPAGQAPAPAAAPTAAPAAAAKASTPKGESAVNAADAAEVLSYLRNLKERFREREVARILRTFRKYCGHEEPGWEWLECETTDNKVYHIEKAAAAAAAATTPAPPPPAAATSAPAGAAAVASTAAADDDPDPGPKLKVSRGASGAVLFGWASGGLVKGFEIRRNQLLRKGAKNPRDVIPRTDPRAVVNLPAGFSVAIIIKIPFPRGNDEIPPEKSLPLDEARGSLLLESSKNRAFAQIRIHDKPAGPAILDVYVNGMMHPVGGIGLLQQRLAGITAFRMTQRLLSNDATFLTNTGTRFLRYFSAHAKKYGGLTPAHFSSGADAAKLQRKPLPVAALNRLETAVASMVQHVQKELFIRARFRLRAVQTIWTALYDLWDAGYMHCDAHGANALFLRRRVTSEDELLQSRGRAFVPDYSLRNIPGGKLQDFEKQLVTREGGLEIYDLNTQNYRFIDTSHYLELVPVLKAAGITKFEGVTPLADNPIAAAIKLPCGAKNRYREDITEALRNCAERLLGASEVLESAGFGGLWAARAKLLETKLAPLDEGAAAWARLALENGVPRAGAAGAPPPEPAVLSHTASPAEKRLLQLLFNFFKSVADVAQTVDRAALDVPVAAFEEGMRLATKCVSEMRKVPPNRLVKSFADFECSLQRQIRVVRPMLDALARALAALPPDLPK